MTFERPGLLAFVPNGDSTRETATMLVALADKHGIDQRSIQVANDGFYITDELADLLYVEDDFDDEYLGEDGEPSDPAGTIAADRQQVELSEEIAVTGENVTVDEAPDTVTNEAIEDSDVHGAVAPVDYETWEYGALRAEVERRGIEVESKKGSVLIDALKASDKTVVE